MVTKYGGNRRPFNQPYYGASGFKPDFKGFHFKFSVLVPIIEIRDGKRKRIFTSEDLTKLNDLFDQDFKGWTSTKRIAGEWVGPKKEVVPNEHIKYEIYTKRHERAIEYFRELKENLEEQKGEDIIVIEQTEVTFMPTLTPRVKSLLRRIRKLEKENNFLRSERKLL